MIELKNKTSVDTKVVIPGLVNVVIPAEGSAYIEDAQKKVKVPTLEGEKDDFLTYPAFDLALIAIKDYGKPGLEFEHEGKLYFFGGSKDLAKKSDSKSKGLL